MNFSRKIKELRANTKMTQSDIAKKLGVTARTYRNYELGKSRPKNREIYYKIANIFSCNINYLLTEDNDFIKEAYDKYGYTGMKQAEILLEELKGLFAGGTLTQDDSDTVMKALQEIYWDAKEENKKYAKKKKDI